MISPDPTVQSRDTANQLINSVSEASFPKTCDILTFSAFTLFSAYVAYMSGKPFEKAGGEGTKYVWPWGIYGLVDENLGRAAALWLNATLNFFFLIDFAMTDGLYAITQRRTEKRLLERFYQLQQFEERLPTWRHILALCLAITGAFAFFVLSYFLNRDSLEIALFTQFAIAAGNIVSAETLLSKKFPTYSDTKKQTLQQLREIIQKLQRNARVSQTQLEACIKTREIQPQDLESGAGEQIPLLDHPNSSTCYVTEWSGVKKWGFRIMTLGPVAYYWQTMRLPFEAGFNWGALNFGITTGWVLGLGTGFLGLVGVISFAILITNSVDRIGQRLCSVYQGIKHEGLKWFNWRRTLLSGLTLASFCFLGTLSANTAQRVNHAQFSDGIGTYILDGLVEMTAAFFNSQGIFFLLQTLLSIGKIITDNLPHSPLPSIKLNWLLHTLDRTLDNSPNTLFNNSAMTTTIQEFTQTTKKNLMPGQ